MHGLIRLDPAGSYVIAEGRANWFPLGLLALAIGAALSDHLFWAAPGAVLSLFSIVGLLQSASYRRVARGVADRMFEYNAGPLVRRVEPGVKSRDPRL